MRPPKAHELLGTVGIHDGEVLTRVDGVSLGSEEGIEEVLLELPTAKEWGLTIGRREGSEWVMIELGIARGT